MGRPEKPLDLPEKPRLKNLFMVLRKLRRFLDLTYADLAAVASVSEATLKRAAGTSDDPRVPKWDAVFAYLMACEDASGSELSPDLTDLVQKVWRLARREERGTLDLRAPRPQFIADSRDLSKALEALYEGVGAPPLRTVQATSGNPLALPLSTLARIVKRETTPGDERQLLAFVRGCGVPAEREQPWKDAWAKASRPLYTAEEEGAVLTTTS